MFSLQKLLGSEAMFFSLLEAHNSVQSLVKLSQALDQPVELEAFARVLEKTGSFYYHCDWHASHCVKVMLDQIFGENHFQNEIVWKRTADFSRWA